MAVRSMRLALLALVAILVCSVYAQATEKSAARVNVGALSTQEIEEQLQVCPMHLCHVSQDMY
jgi:ABC-type phosphate/phosphonate transport system substrate-binding protein